MDGSRRSAVCFAASLVMMTIVSQPQRYKSYRGSRMSASQDDSFELYDLRVEVNAPADATIYCGARPGDYFELRGEMLYLPPGQGFSIYSLAALLPLLPAKQRPTHPYDWMTSDAEVACPDPNCSTHFRIQRLGLRKFSHTATTAVPLSKA